MKNLKMIALGILMFFASTSINAQISVNVNLGSPPSWGPVGYSSADYYYLPDVQTYYDVRATQFIYLNNGAWIRSSRLPNQYRSYDLNRGYKVVLNDYHGARPYDNYRNHKVKYYKGYKGKPQKSIGYRNHGNDNHKSYKAQGNFKSHGNDGNKGHGNKGHGNNGKGH